MVFPAQRESSRRTTKRLGWHRRPDVPRVSKGVIATMGGRKPTFDGYLGPESSKMFVIDAQAAAFNHIDFMTLQRVVEVLETAPSRSGS